VPARLLRLIPYLPALSRLERLAGAYARRSLQGGVLPLPRSVRAFPAHVANVRKRITNEREALSLTAARAEFLVARMVLSRALNAWSPAEIRRRLGEPVVEGAHHLRAALDKGRGVVLVTPHFGLPALVRLVLDAYGFPFVVGSAGRDGHKGVRVTGSTWERTQTLQHFRAQLAAGSAVVILPDSSNGRHVRLPFLGSKVSVALGPFGLARVAGCDVVPFFGLRPPGSGSFRVDFLAPLGDDGSPERAPREFVSNYEAYAERLPSHLHGLMRVLRPRTS
jgi:lauroyl/myristoyl acyltransferase